MDSADDEVRKLQDLVKKLERQNELLRTKQGSILDKPKRQTTNHHNNNENIGVKINNDINSRLDDIVDYDDKEFKCREQLVLDDLEDVDCCLLDPEDSWLYSSPQHLSNPRQPEDRIVKWVRGDMDNSSPELDYVRRSLLVKLDEAARMKHSYSSPVLGSHPNASKSASNLSRSSEEAAAPPTRGIMTPQRRSGLAAPGTNKVFDSGTFTRPKKTSNGGPPILGEGDAIDMPTAPNAADIESLAKQQEESLRQSITTPNTRKGYRGKHDLIEGDNPRLSPSRFDMEGSYLAQHRGSLGSETSTPPDSPQYNQQFQLNNSNDSRNRRGVQTLSNLQYNRSHNSSDSSLERHSVNSDEMNIAPEAMRTASTRLQQPSSYRNGTAPRRSITNSSSIQQPMRGLSPSQNQPARGLSPSLGQPTRGKSPNPSSGLPMPRRQIARPSTGTRTSLPTFRRSAIPSSKPSSAREPEDNWRDGCF